MKGNNFVGHDKADFLIRTFFVYSVESKNNTTLDGCGKPNSEMLEIMARRQQKLAQKNGQGRRM